MLTREELQAKLNEVKDSKDQIDLRNLLSNRLCSYKLSEAKETAEQALQESKKITYEEGIVDSLNSLGAILTRMGKLDEAKKMYYGRARNKAKEISYNIGLAQAYIGLARYFQLKGLFDSALGQLQKSEDILNSIPDKTELLLPNRTLALCYHGMGVIYFYDKATLDEAENFFEKSLAMMEKSGSREDIAIAHYSLGEVLQTKKEDNDAKKYFDLSLKENESINNPYIKANVFQGEGDIHLKNKSSDKFDKALECYKKSEKLFEDIGDKFQIAAIKRDIGICYNDMKKYKMAKEYLLKALILAEEMENSHTIKTIAQQLEIVCKNLGEIKNQKKYSNLAELEDEFMKANSGLRAREAENAKTKLKYSYLILILAIVCLGIILAFFLMAMETNKELERQKIGAEATNKELEKQKIRAEKSLSDIELLTGIGKNIISSLSVKEIIDKVYQSVNRIMEATVFGICIHNPETKALDALYKEKGVNLPEFSFFLNEKERMAVHCFEKQENIRTENYPEEYKRFSPIKPDPKQGETFNSHIFIPLTLQFEDREPKKIGVITVQSKKIKAYDDFHEKMLGNIANYTAIALDNARALATIEKQASQLKQSLEMERELSNLKDQFMYTLSHQYKTPLTNIDLAQQYMKKYKSGIIDEQINKYLDTISRNVIKMQELINKLFNYGKKFNPALHDMNKLLREVVNGIKSGNGVTHQVIFHSESKLNEVFIDKELVKILVNNLIINSIKYSEKGSEIKVSYEVIDNNAVIKVEDHGRGIPEDIFKLKDKRFQRGFNVQDTEGTGLGLSIVEHYVTLHGGTINYQSKLNEGTTVTISLPLQNKIEK